jgi:hypothetical protein
VNGILLAESITHGLCAWAQSGARDQKAQSLSCGRTRACPPAVVRPSAPERVGALASLASPSIPLANPRINAAHPRVNSRPAARKCWRESCGSLVIGDSVMLLPVCTRLRMKTRVASVSSSCSCCTRRLWPPCVFCVSIYDHLFLLRLHTAWLVCTETIYGCHLHRHPQIAVSHRSRLVRTGSEGLLGRKAHATADQWGSRDFAEVYFPLPPTLRPIPGICRLAAFPTYHSQ